MTKQEKTTAALQDFFGFCNDSNVSVDEIVKKAKEVVKEAK